MEARWSSSPFSRSLPHPYGSTTTTTTTNEDCNKDVARNRFVWAKIITNLNSVDVGRAAIAKGEGEKGNLCLQFPFLWDIYLMSLGCRSNKYYVLNKDLFISRKLTLKIKSSKYQYRIYKTPFLSIFFIKRVIFDYKTNYRNYIKYLYFIFCIQFQYQHYEAYEYISKNQYQLRK